MESVIAGKFAADRFDSAETERFDDEVCGNLGIVELFAVDVEDEIPADTQLIYLAAFELGVYRERI